MTVVRADAEGLREAGRVLDVGQPVVLPLPTPLPYFVAARDATAVNVAKGRPPAQAAGMLLADLTRAAPHLELDAESVALARWLSARELLNLLLPVGENVPGWMRPSTAEGWLSVTLACLDDVRSLLDPRGHLYISTAGRVGGALAFTAAAADAAFASELLVVDGDAHRDPAAATGPATVVRVTPGGQLELVRQGAGYEGDGGRFVQQLAERWRRAG
jgi:tRNA A37 threonylcarbamoyladenosine synthetase subunit TsaC/SUA5/YrdC